MFASVGLGVELKGCRTIFLLFSFLYSSRDRKLGIRVLGLGAWVD